MKTMADIEVGARAGVVDASRERPSPSPGGEVAAVELGHDYGGAVALDRVNLEIRAGEFVTLLGASGSGKSTLLHIVAGLIDPTKGRVLLDGRDITPLPPQRRDIGMVFQNYALFPHMTAAGNVDFPLSARKVPGERASARVEEMLQLVRLETLGERLPGQLSGGQQQRVAIARALAPTPRVLLLDEPLGALDKRLRQELGRELRRIQQETGVTTIYVTHDQDEALSLSDRVAVMDKGNVRQVGTPEEIYDTPASEFVASFVGEVNILYGKVTTVANGRATVDLDAGGPPIGAVDRHGLAPGTAVGCAVRPERVRVWRCDEVEAPAGAAALGEARIDDVVYLGGSRELALSWGERRLTARVPSKGGPAERGERVVIGWAEEDVALFAHQ